LKHSDILSVANSQYDGIRVCRAVLHGMAIVETFTSRANSERQYQRAERDLPGRDRHGATGCIAADTASSSFVALFE
jgi:hypothetical protein